MFDRLYATAARFRSTLTVEQQRTVLILGVLSTIVLTGLTVTGIWQFFAHESDPNWFDHIVGSETRQPTSASTGVASLHGTFSTAGGALALIGGAWYAYRVVFSIPWLWMLALGLAIFGSISGSLIRFNAVRLSGRSYEDADAGYAQIFLGDIDVVVTDRWDFGPTAIRLFSATHMLSVPLLLGLVWISIGPKRTATL